MAGIGPATASGITELLTTGTSTLQNEVQGAYPSSLAELGDVLGLSMKEIKRLYERAGIASIAALQDACVKDKLRHVPGFGPKVQAKILAALGEYQRGQGSHLYANVLPEALALTEALGSMFGDKAVSLAGAIRGKLEVINEVAFVFSCPRKQSVVSVAEGLKAIPNVSEISLCIPTS